jgi:hypothetical protein
MLGLCLVAALSLAWIPNATWPYLRLTGSGLGVYAVTSAGNDSMLHFTGLGLDPFGRQQWLRVYYRDPSEGTVVETNGTMTVTARDGLRLASDSLDGVEVISYYWSGKNKLDRRVSFYKAGSDITFSDPATRYLFHDGVNTYDVNLYRQGKDSLKTDDALLAASLSVDSVMVGGTGISGIDTTAANQTVITFTSGRRITFATTKSGP